MSQQPLTNLNLSVVFIARSQMAVDDELRNYNFDPDAFGIPPVVEQIVYTSFAAFLENTPDNTLPCVIVGNPPSDLYQVAKQFMTNIVTTPVALEMMNNEYAIRRDQIINGTVTQK